MPHKRKAAGGNGGLFQDAQFCATALLHYNILSHAKQVLCQWLSSTMLRAALVMVNAGDYLAGLAVLLDCYAAARGGL